MRKIVITMVLACSGITALVIFLIAPLRAQTASTASRPGATAEAVKYRAFQAAEGRAFLDKYCVACHSNRAANPAEGPVNLESARFDEPLGHAETWERVLRKLSVRAMPPPGLPRPSEAEYAGFTSWLGASLDRAWEGHNTPGRYVVHRLNRAEYANAIRDLLAVDIDVTDLLPTDGAEFGFDNIATALRTSPLLLEGYVNAAERVSAMAVGDPQVKPGTTEHSISREFSQNGYIEGLPLGQSVARLSVTYFRLTPSINCRVASSAVFRKATQVWKATTRRTSSSSRWTELKCIRRRLAVPRTTRFRPPIWPRRSPLSTRG